MNDYQVTGPDNKPNNQTGKKKSLFARQFDKTHNFVPREREKGREQKPGVANVRLVVYFIRASFRNQIWYNS